jgi:hypothetical protein
MSRGADDAGHSDLRVPDVGFSTTQLAAARAVLAEQATKTRIGLAVLGGSLAVGLGHTLSDVDLYIVYLGPPSPITTVDRQGVQVHIEAMTREAFVALGALGARFQATSDDRRQLFLAESDLKQLVRLATGHRLAHDDIEPELIALLPDRHVVRQILMSRYACDFAVAAEDAFGAADIRDWYTAMAASLAAVLCAAEAALAAADDVYHGAKFLFRRLARTSATCHLVPDLWALTQAPANVAHPHEWARTIVERRLLAGSHLLAWSLLDGWERPLDRLPEFPQWTAAGPRRHPAYSPLRFVDGVALAGPHKGAQVSEGMLRVWRRLNGADLADTLSCLGQHEPDFRAIPEATLTAAVDKLHGYGAVEVERLTSERR